MTYEEIVHQFIDSSWPSIMMVILLIIVISIVLFWLINMAMDKSQKRIKKLMEKHNEDGDHERFKRLLTIVGLTRFSLRASTLTLAVVMILSTLGVDLRPLLAGAGVVGVAVGFGAQSLIKDFFSGFFIILENQIRVGDVVKVNGVGGLVEEINFRTVILRDLEGVVHIFPNGSIEQTSNLTKDWSAAVFNIGVAYKENPVHVMEVMKNVAVQMRSEDKYRYDIIEDMEVFGIENFADSSVIIKARLKTRPIKQWDIAREYRKRLKIEFDSEQIEIPFPHCKVVMDNVSASI